MPDKEKEGAGLSAGGVFVILTLLLGFFIVPDQPFKTSRQPVPDKAKSAIQESPSVEARLWEDPFEAVKRSKDYQSPPADRPKVILDHRIAEGILDTAQKGITVLGVMVPGGPYAESSEARRRSRFAVLSGLAEQDYSPDASDQLRFLWFPSRGPKTPPIDPRAVIPYEFYSPGPSASKKTSPAPRVLVLWLNQDLLHPRPLMELGNLISGIKEEVRQQKKEKGLSPLNMRFKLLGPADSTTLKAMVDEAAVLSIDDTYSDLADLHDVEMFCWGATADRRFLIEDPEREEDESVAESKLEQAIKQKLPLRFHRTIGTDRQLVEALVGELERRAIKPCSDHIALISEWDTIYGRTLPRTFARSAQKDSACRNIHRFTYMRGIDGQILKTGAGETASEAAPQGTRKKDARPEGIEKPLGSSQFDYLRRLAKELKALDERISRETRPGNGIRAIGVLGSDIYDKLLVLQAVYELFPRAVFFTTDMDARYLHPDELEWTRNLVIASSFGLRLHPDLQKNTPPFRDTYQTALFFATRLAMTRAMEGPEISECLATWLRAPMLFEVGRTNAFHLKTEIDSAKTPPEPCDHLASVLTAGSAAPRSLHPPAGVGGNMTPLKIAALVTVPTLLFLAVVCLVAERGWRVSRDTSRRMMAVAVALILLAATAAVLLWLIEGQEAGGEPLELLEGISLWPTVYLRLVAFGTAAAFIWAIWRRSRRLEGELQGYFIDADSRDAAQDPAAPASDAPSDCRTCALWEDYRRRTKPGARFWRVSALAFFYMVLCGAIINGFGLPFVPFRGTVSEMMHNVSLGLAVVSFVCLLFLVVDATSMAVWFIKQLQRGHGAWSEKRKALAAERCGIGREELNDWVGIEVIVRLTDTDNKFIYYPIIVIILMWVSRLSHFDRYDMPAGLLIVIFLGLGFSISCAIRLRAAAEQMRKDVLKRLWEKMVRLAGESHEAKGSSKQIDLMIGHIKSIRSGAFVPFIEQPWVRATLIFITSGGGLTALQYLPWFQW